MDLRPPLQCPSCGNQQSRPSEQRRPLDFLMRFAHMVPYRCRVCGLRYYEHKDEIPGVAQKASGTARTGPAS